MRFLRRFFWASISACLTSAVSSRWCCCLLDFFTKWTPGRTRPETPSILSEFRACFSRRLAREAYGEAGLQLPVLRLLRGSCSPGNHPFQKLLLAPAQAALAKALDQRIDLGVLIEVG